MHSHLKLFFCMEMLYSTHKKHLQKESAASALERQCLDLVDGWILNLKMELPRRLQHVQILRETIKMLNFNYLTFACEMRPATKIFALSGQPANCEHLNNSVISAFANGGQANINI